MPPFIAFLDANVLYPAELRSFLMYLAVSGIYRAKWSAETPDEFIHHLLDLFPAEVFQAAEDHRTSLKNPPKTVEQYLTSLELQGLTKTVAALRSLYDTECQ